MEATSDDETSVDMTGEEDAWAWSNLGGLGPDTDAPSQTFRRSKVGKVGNVFIDLVVSNVTEYKPRLQAGRAVDWSGSVVNGYGQISLDGTIDPSATTHMDLKLSFVEHGTDTPYTLTKFRFAFFDFDSVSATGGIDCLELDTTHIASYSVHPQTELSPPALDLSQPNPKVCATTVGNGKTTPRKTRLLGISRPSSGSARSRSRTPTRRRSSSPSAPPAASPPVAPSSSRALRRSWTRALPRHRT